MADLVSTRSRENPFSKAIILVEELQEKPRPSLGRIKLTPVLFDNNGTLKLGTSWETQTWLCPVGSSEAPATWRGTRTFQDPSQFHLCLNESVITSRRVFGPPFRTEHTGFKYKLFGVKAVECAVSDECGNGIRLEYTGTVDLPSIIPSSVFSLSEREIFLGTENSVLSVDPVATETPVTRIHSFAKVAKKCVAALAYSPKSQMLVGVDDAVWPKFAFVFRCGGATANEDEPGSAAAEEEEEPDSASASVESVEGNETELLFTASLPEAQNEYCDSAFLGGPDGDILIISARFHSRLGVGHRLIILQILEDSFEELATYRDIAVNDEEATPQEAIPDWRGIVMVGDSIVAGADKGILVWGLHACIAGNVEPLVLDVDGCCISIVVHGDGSEHLVAVLVHRLAQEEGTELHLFHDLVIVDVSNPAAPKIVNRSVAPGDPVAVL